MSMLSAQCDELRSMSESVGLAVPQAATLMIGAADTIDGLDAENAKLMGLVSVLAHCMNDVDRCDTCPVNGNPYDVRAGDWAACDTLRDMLRELGVEL